jgi:KDO2-lipid IV(A) lauroyltransferase
MRELIDILATLFFKILFRVLCVLPEEFGFMIVRFILSIIFLFIPRFQKVAKINLQQIFPEKTLLEREKIRKQSINVLAKNIVYSALIKNWTIEEFEARVDIKDFKAKVEEMHQIGVGIMFPAMHFGCFELLAQAVSKCVNPISVLFRDLTLPRLNKMLKELRTNSGNDVFSRDGGYEEIVERLKKGVDVGVLCDQNIKSNHATFVPFFGIPASTTKALAIAALRVRCRVLFTVIIEERPGHFKVHFKEIPNPRKEPGSLDQKVHKFMENIHHEMEQVIRAHPDHWFWIHRRFKTRPPGEKETFYD